MKKLTPIIFFTTSLFLFLILTQSCQDKINLLPDKDQLKGVAIQGKLIKGNPSIVQATIEPIFTFSGESRKFLDITSVSLEDEKGNEFFLSLGNTISDYIGLIPTGQTDLEIEFGQKYRLNVLIEGATMYQSDFESLLPVPVIDGLSFEVYEENIRDNIGDFTPAKFIRFRVTTPLTTPNQSEKSFLKWELDRAFTLAGGTNSLLTQCYYIDGANIQHVAVVNGNLVNGDMLNGFNFYEDFINFPFAGTYYLTVFQESLSESAFKYWNEVSTITKSDGNMFEAVPGKIRGNFENISNPDEQVYGFFYATSRKSRRIRVCPSQLGFQPPIITCLGFGASSTPPFYWEDCE